MGQGGRGPALVVGVSEALAAVLAPALVADGWTVERPRAPEGSASGDAGSIEALGSAPFPPSAVILGVDPQAPIVPMTAAIARWVGRLAPEGSAVIVREFAPEPTYAERLAEGALATMTRELARGAAPDRRVNAVYGAPAAPDPSALPCRRPGTPGDLASAAVFLAGRSSRFITGVTLRLDGGAGLVWSLSGL